MRGVIQIIKTLCLLIGLLVVQIESKKVVQTINLQQIKINGNIYFAAKFAMDEGIGEFSVKAKLEKPARGNNLGDADLDLVFLSIVDDEWRKFQEEGMTCQYVRRHSTAVSRLNLPKDATFSSTVRGMLNSRKRRHVWFFVFEDCYKSLEKLYSNQITFELTILNVGNSHFPSDEGNFVWYYFIISVAFSWIFLQNIRRLKDKYLRSEEMDWPLLLVEISMGLWALGNLMNWLHWLIYGYDGEGLFLVELLAQIFANCSGYIMTIVLVLLSWGWTINQLSNNFYDQIIPLAIILGAVQLIIVGMGKLTDDSHSKYHQYDGWAGYTILILRLSLCTYFGFGIKNTLASSKVRVRLFIQELGFFGILYFLAFPILLFISNFLAPYVQHTVMKNGMLLLESFSIFLLHYLFTSKKTEYYKMSEKGSTLLPNIKDL